MERVWIGLGSLLGLLAVGMAATTAHLLADPAAVIAGRAVQMQGWHALALIGTGLWARRGGLAAHLAAAAFALGTVAFCGAVYALALQGAHLGPLAPVGGTLLMVGWALLGISALRSRA